MAMIDIKNLEKLNPAQRQQFDALLENFPHLESKMETARELNTPTKIEDKTAMFIEPTARVDEELDYSNFMSPPIQQPTPEDLRNIVKNNNMPSLKIDPTSERSFSSLEPPAEEKDNTPQNTEQKIKLKREQQVRAAIAAGQAPEVASFNPEGKVHPILHKLRATMGMRSIQKPVEFNVGGCRYGMKPLDRMAVANATALALSTTENPAIYQANLENSLIAHAVVEIDNAPVADIFSIPLVEPKEDGQQLPISAMRREQLAAEALYVELLKSPNELVEALSTYYQQEFPPLDLLMEGKAKFLCPVGDCLQSRISDANEDCFCPIHGEKMAREDKIPNPL